MISPPAASHWTAVLQNLHRAHGFEPLRVEGTIPPRLRGTLYRNGPMVFERFDGRIRHFFDGDGGLEAIRFGARGAEGALRVLNTEGYRDEERAGRFLYAGFGWPGRGRRRLRFKNVANTHVLPWRGHLLALWEAGLPTAVDPESLEAQGTTDFGGVLRGAFSAHPHRVPSRRAHYNFGLRMGRRTRLDFYELPDEGPARHLTGVALARPTMIHDFAVTENHLIAFVPPLTIRLPAFLLGLRPLGRSFAWRPEWGTEVIVVPIDRPREVARFRTEPFWFWHFANAFERGGRLHADVVRVADFSHFAGAEGFTRGERGLGDEGRLTRAEIDPAGRRVRFTRPWERGCDFPRVAPSVEAGPYRYAYVACHGSPAAAKARWFDAVARVDVEAGSADVYVATAGAVLSEPIFAPDPEGEAEDAGWLLVDVHDPARGESGALILDARAIDKGPLASCWYGEPVPLRFHGAWIPT